jgi:hypothetical protein
MLIYNIIFHIGDAMCRVVRKNTHFTSCNVIATGSLTCEVTHDAPNNLNVDICKQIIKHNECPSKGILMMQKLKPLVLL